jgi:hypothetical protein
MKRIHAESENQARAQENIAAIHLFDKDLLSRVHKEA